MGTKGRDVIMWLIIINGAIALFTGSGILSCVEIVLCAAFFYSILEARRAIKYEYIRLVPVNRHWAKLLVRNRIVGCWDRAYEVHVKYRPGEDVRKQRDGVERDLQLIYETRPGLYLWETATSVPGSFKKLIREKAAEGKAFWEKGCFLPRPPFVYDVKFRKPLRHGAILHEGAVVILSKNIEKEIIISFASKGGLGVTKIAKINAGGKFVDLFPVLKVFNY
ncbi:hypothetical protein GFC01_17245 [Desulfofundulus thermobenzoicus]|uniref:Uncharacterized protein n=1 Tax=Desulfofundulus thermobenzoicus TaxID=29376 RepID=A0A6N7IVN7_9FIRM|nr:hypothetical protein [Desulfofundulus thermobenzoicus]MQL53971.1 hypothetical protein [Desulfofundulus thermobenzoicus]